MLSPIAIERIAPIPYDDFYSRYVTPSRPIVISGLVNNWQALALWTPEYFARQYGEVRVTTQESNQKGELVADGNKGVQLATTIINRCIEDVSPTNFKIQTFITTSVDDFPAQLKNEYIPPLYCKDGKFLKSRIFISPLHSITPLHQDLPENLFVLVNGQRRITLFAPQDHVYPYPRFSRLPNFAQPDIENVNYERFPKLAKAQPYMVDLAAGETLFIPSFWWHHFHSMAPSIGINFWWNQGWKIPIAWIGAMYGKLRGLGNYSVKK